MAGKLERFTRPARRVLTLAQESAAKTHHDYIDTEHLLLGLLLEESGVAGKVLRGTGVSARQVEEMIERTTGTGRTPTQGSVGLTSRTKRVIELAVDQARRMGQHYIGTEHLLLGLVAQGDGAALDILKHLGIAPERVREETLKQIQENPTEAADAGGIDLRPAIAQKVTVTADTLSVDLTDGRTISVPLAWYPRLLHGNEEERSNWRLMGQGIHWPDLEEDISVEHLLLGIPSQESQASLKRWLEKRSPPE